MMHKPVPWSSTRQSNWYLRRDSRNALRLSSKKKIEWLGQEEEEDASNGGNWSSSWLETQGRWAVTEAVDFSPVRVTPWAAGPMRTNAFPSLVLRCLTTIQVRPVIRIINCIVSIFLNEGSGLKVRQTNYNAGQSWRRDQCVTGLF